MGIFFRKSISLGPLRFNLSGSGIGVSTGIKGLRVGVSGKGKAYVAGGRGGLYFRQYASGSRSSRRSAPVEVSPAPVATPAKPANFLAALIMVTVALAVLGFLRFEFFIAAGAAGAVVIIVAIIQIISRSRLKAWRNGMADAIKTGDRGKIKEISGEIASLKDTKKRQALLAQFYPDLVLSFFHDRALDKDEEEIHALYNLSLPDDVVKNINFHMVNELLHSIALDRRIDEGEEALVRRTAALLKLPEMNEEINRVVRDYRELEKIETGGLMPIKPKMNINDASECYYEGACTVMKRKTSGGVAEVLPDKEGTLLITRDNLHIVTDGHTAIKATNIIKIEKHDEGTLEMVLNNRKTPLYIQVKDPMAVMGMVKSIITKS